ncbi:MAG: hypothetical protein ABT20_12420 [Rubrivivax sp. SCN 70-15]|nr:MAG: hypothetical protein ABT20_12420 [Rubrivivax sp. SCN 70-15]
MSSPNAHHAPSPAQRRRTAPRGAKAALPPPPPQELLEGPTREVLVRRRAYELYERNGRVDGRALDDWLSAEAEVEQQVLEGSAPLESRAERG